RDAFRQRVLLLGERALVVVRHHLDELRERYVPLLEHACSDRRAGALGVLGDERADGLDVVLVERFEADELHVAAAGGVAVHGGGGGGPPAPARGGGAAGAGRGPRPPPPHVPPA